MKKLILKLMLVSLVAGGASAASTDKTSASKNVAGGAQMARAEIRDWPLVSQNAAEAMLDRYGQPDVVSSLLLVWKDKAPFTKIVVTRDPIRHSFPVDHQDVILEEIPLQVPVDKVADLAKFNGSLLIDRTQGTLASRCDSEKSNFLALNLANEIITGKRDADSARRFMSDTSAKSLAGKSSPYSEKLMFTPKSGDASAYPDAPMLKEMQSMPVEPLPQHQGY